MGFKNSFDNQIFTSKELQIVQDADRLDAMGAIGIARAFNFGGFKNRDLYNPAIEPNLNQSKAGKEFILSLLSEKYYSIRLEIPNLKSCIYYLNPPSLKIP